METLGRPNPGRLQSSMSLGVSCVVHGALLVWLAVTAANTPREIPKSLYDLEIRPYEKQIVWYNLREKLPDIKPVPAPAAAKKPRAQKKFQQTLVSGTKDDARVPQMIATDSPPVELPRPLPLPNAVAEAAPPPPPREFVPPLDTPKPDAPSPALPDSPRADPKINAAVNPLDASAPRPEPLPFRQPEKKKVAAAPPPQLADAPNAAAPDPRVSAAPLGPTAERPQPLPFHPPPELVRPRTTAPLTLPETPAVAAARTNAPAAPMGDATPRPQPRAFQTPTGTSGRSARTTLTLPEAPASASPPPATASAPRIPRGFTAPAKKAAAKAEKPSIPDPAPAVSQPGATGTESFAIAGLNPSKMTEVPELPPSHAAGFSAAPEVRPGPDAAPSNEKASLVVPSLTAGGGVRDSMPTMAPAPDPAAHTQLMAELRTPLTSHLPPPGVANAASSKALRVSSSPDPRMAGRVVYTMAIQMPNVTSYSGSWMVWFAEHVPEPGVQVANVRPPMPRHKVDPAYIRSAVDDHIQGVVRLAAVIDREGRVGEIEILSGIDSRLDESAERALAKWLFEPALREGVPIAVDAVFEVPFRLAPKTSR